MNDGITLEQPTWQADSLKREERKCYQPPPLGDDRELKCLRLWKMLNEWAN